MEEGEQVVGRGRRIDARSFLYTAFGIPCTISLLPRQQSELSTLSLELLLGARGLTLADDSMLTRRRSSHSSCFHLAY